MLFRVCLAIFLVGMLFAGDGVHWSYSGDEGPQSWGELSPEFNMCSEGKNQSPINLTEFIDAQLAPISLTYAAVRCRIVNNGHTVKVDFETGSSLQVEGRVYRLLQFHAHSPSENQIEGHSFTLELHLVHGDEYGNLAVIGVMVAEGETNGALASFWKKIPEKEGDSAAIQDAITPEQLLPGDRSYFRFNGSLTTPPCSEGVLWLVMRDPITASKEQIKAFTEVIHGANNRPIQPLNARTVLY